MKRAFLLLILPFLCSAQTQENATLRPSYIDDHGFNADMLVSLPLDAVPASRLNVFPKVEATVPMRFPKELSQTGFVGHISGAVAFGSDGKVIRQQVTGGNSSLLMDAAMKYVGGLRFGEAFLYGKPVSTMISFEVFITEEGTYGPFFEHTGRSPNA